MATYNKIIGHGVLSASFLCTCEESLKITVRADCQHELDAKIEGATEVHDAFCSCLFARSRDRKKRRGA